MSLQCERTSAVTASLQEHRTDLPFAVSAIVIVVGVRALLVAFAVASPVARASCVGDVTPPAVATIKAMFDDIAAIARAAASIRLSAQQMQHNLATRQPKIGEAARGGEPRRGEGLS